LEGHLSLKSVGFVFLITNPRKNMIVLCQCWFDGSNLKFKMDGTVGYEILEPI